MYKKNICLILIFIFECVTTSKAQKCFSNLYDLYGGWESANAVLHYDTQKMETVLSGTFINFFVSDTTKYRHAVLWKIDSTGKQEIKALFASPPDNLIGFIPLYTSNSIILKYEVQRQNSFDNRLVYMSKNGDTICSFQVHYPPKFNSLTYTLHPKSKYIYSTGTDITFSASTTAPFAVLCIDTTGKKLWYKTFPGKRRFSNSVVVDNDGMFLIAGSSYSGDGGAFDTISGWYAKMDTSGNLIWERFLDKDTITKSQFVQVFKLDNYIFLFGGNDASRPNSQDTSQSYTSIYRINPSNGLINSYNRFLYNPEKLGVWVDMYESSSSGMYGIGGYETKEGTNNYTQYLMFLKLDNNGNLKWRRQFKQWYKDNRAYSLTAIPDGFIICADGKDTTHTTGFTDAWIIKTDTNGCVIPGCHLLDGVTEVMDPKNYVQVYPNPAENKVTIDFRDPNHTLIEQVEILNANGQCLESHSVNNCQASFSTEHLPDGLYYFAAYFNKTQRIVKKVMVQHE